MLVSHFRLGSLKGLLITSLLIFLLSCGGAQPLEKNTPITTSDVSISGVLNEPALEECGESEVVRFQASDGVDLVADYIPPAGEHRGAVVLFHMIPPSNNRSGFPPRIREAFAGLGVGVLNVDRRGAGDSAGSAADAYLGDTAQLDVSAAVRFLLSSERLCTTERTKIMLIGASNGTTSVMDYTVSRVAQDLPMPAAIAWLSPGRYTENQNKIVDFASVLSAIPTLIIHPENETWSVQLDGFSENWRRVSLVGGMHGTRNFDMGTLEAIQQEALLSWMKEFIVDAL